MRLNNNLTTSGVLKDTLQSIKKMNVYESTNKINELKNYRDRLILKKELQDEMMKTMVAKPLASLRRSSSQLPEESQSDETKQIIKLNLERKDLNKLSTDFLGQSTKDEVIRQRITTKNQSYIAQKQIVDELPILKVVPENSALDAKKIPQDPRNNFRIVDYQRQINDFETFYLNQGIDFDSNKIVPHQKFYNYYCKKTSALIDRIIKQQQRDITKSELTPFDLEKQTLSQRSTELLSRNHQLYQRHYQYKKRDQGRQSVPHINLEEQIKNQQPSPSKQDNLNLSQTQSIEPLRRRNTSMVSLKFDKLNFQNLNQEINKVEQDFKHQDQQLQESLVQLSELFNQTERKHNDKTQINVKIEKQDVTDYLVNTQKVWTSYLYKKKVNQFSKLRKLNILKSQQLEVKQQ